MISVTIFDSGRTLNAQTLEAFWISIAHAKPLSVGINCALGTDQMRPYVEEFSRIAGVIQLLPECRTTRSPFTHRLSSPARGYGPPHARLRGQRWLNIAGGCCGNTPEHIKCIAEAVRDIAPRPLPQRAPVTTYAGLEPFTLRPEFRSR